MDDVILTWLHNISVTKKTVQEADRERKKRTVDPISTRDRTTTTTAKSAEGGVRDRYTGFCWPGGRPSS